MTNKHIMRAVRIMTYADPGDDPEEYNWWIEGTHNGKDWCRFADCCESNYATAKAMVDVYNYECSDLRYQDLEAVIAYHKTKIEMALKMQKEISAELSFTGSMRKL